MPTDKASIVKQSILSFLIIVAGLQIFGVLGWNSDTLDAQCESIEAATAKQQKENQQLEQKLDDLTAQVQALPSDASIATRKKKLRETISSRQQTLQNLRVQREIQVLMH